MADVATGSVLLTPKFDGLMTSINDQLTGAFSGASSLGAKAGASTGESYSTGLSVKAGAAMGLVSAVTSKAFNAISNGLGSAISRVDTLNNYPKVMQNLGYSSDDATASIKRIQSSLEGLPSSTNSVASVVQTLAPLCSNLDEATTLGLSLNDMMLASGASTSDVNRAMQQYTQMLSKGSVDLQSWRTLQEVMPGQLNQVAQALLGAGASSTDLYSALQDGTVTMDDFNNAVMELDQNGGEGFASFSQQAKDATQGIGTAMSNVQNRISAAIAKIIDAIGAENISGAINAFSSSFSGIGSAVATVIYGAKDVIGSAIDGICSLFDTLKSALPDGFLDGIANAFNAIAPAIVPAIAAFAAFLPVVGTVKKVVSAVQGLGTALGIIGSGPVGIVVAAIAAFVVGLAALYNSNETVRNAIDSAWQQIQAAASAVWPYIQQAVSTAMTTIQNVVAVAWPIIQQVFTTTCSVIQAIVQTVWPVIQTVIETVMSAIQLFITTVWPVIQSYFQLACTAIQAVVSAVWPIIQSIITTAMSVIQAVIAVAWPIIQALITTAMTVIQAIITTVWPIIQSVVTSVMSVIQAIISTVMAAIQGDWSGVWSGIQSVASAIWSGIKSVVSTCINAVSSTISSVLGAIKSIWSSCWNGVKSAFSNIWNGIKSAASSGVNTVYNTVTGIKDKILGFFSGAGSWLVNSGKALLQGFANGVSNAIGSVTSTVSGALSSIRSLFPFSPAKRGPFSGHGYTTYSGRALMGDFGQSIKSAAGGVVSDAKSALAEVNSLFGATPLALATGGSLSGTLSGYRATSYDVNGIGQTNLYLDGSLVQMDEYITGAITELVGYVKRTARG